MKTSKIIMMGACVSMLVSSCGSTGSGAMTGAYFGSILGSAVGGILGGPRGHDVGTIIGMATGAATGAAIGNANEQEREEAIRRSHERVKDHDRHHYEQQYDDSGYDATNSGDDRIYDFHSSDYTGNYSAAQPTTVMPGHSHTSVMPSRNLAYSGALEIRRARFVDGNSDRVLKRGESGKIIFEITNVSKTMLYDILPSVMETTGNRNIIISPSVHVECIAPGQTLRYTAIVQATKGLKNGNAKFAISVVQGNKTISKVTEFNIRTSK